MFYVYSLVDNGRPFYVGVTTQPDRRLQHHLRDTASAAHQRCKLAAEAGRIVTIQIVGTFDDRIAAKKLERHLVLSDESLVNSRNPKGMLSLPLYPLD